MSRPTRHFDSLSPSWLQKNHSDSVTSNFSSSKILLTKSFCLVLFSNRSDLISKTTSPPWSIQSTTPTSPTLDSHRIPLLVLFLLIIHQSWSACLSELNNCSVQHFLSTRRLLNYPLVQRPCIMFQVLHYMVTTSLSMIHLVLWTSPPMSARPKPEILQLSPKPWSTMLWKMDTLPKGSKISQNTSTISHTCSEIKWAPIFILKSSAHDLQASWRHCTCSSSSPTILTSSSSFSEEKHRWAPRSWANSTQSHQSMGFCASHCPQANTVSFSIHRLLAPRKLSDGAANFSNSKHWRSGIRPRCIYLLWYYGRLSQLLASSAPCRLSRMPKLHPSWCFLHPYPCITRTNNATVHFQASIQVIFTTFRYKRFFSDTSGVKMDPTRILALLYMSVP